MLGFSDPARRLLLKAAAKRANGDTRCCCGDACDQRRVPHGCQLAGRRSGREASKPPNPLILIKFLMFKIIEAAKQEAQF